MGTKKFDDLTATVGASDDILAVSRNGSAFKVPLSAVPVSREQALALYAGGSPSFDPTLLPFSSHSPWRLGIAQEAKFAAANDPRNVTLNDVSKGVYVNYYQYSHPVAIASTSDPLATVTDSYHSTTTIPPGGVWKEYIPADAIIAAGTDRHMNVITPDKKDVIEHFATTRVDANTYTTTRRHRTSLRGSGLGPQGGTRAYGGSSIGGLIRLWEMDPAHPSYTGRIDHPIAIALTSSQLKYTGMSTLPAVGGYDAWGYGRQLGYVWPATEQDGNSNTNYSGTIPMGSYFAIPSSLDLTSLNLATVAGRMVAQALQDYGAYVTDRTGTTAMYLEDAAAAAEGAFAAQLLANGSSELKVLFANLRVVTSNTASTPNGGTLGTPRRGVIALPAQTTPGTSTPSLGGPAVALTAAGTLTGGVPNTVDSSAGAFTATLPTPTSVGQLLTVEKVDTSTNAVTISGTIRGSAATIVLPGIGVAYESILFEAETLTSWRPIAGHKPKAWLDALYAQVGEPVTAANSGVALTLNGLGVNDVTLTGNATLTFPALPAAGSAKTFVVVLRQDATGGRTVTWPATVKWPGGVAPVLSAAASKIDVFTFTSIDATTWLGFTGGLDLR